MHSNDKLSRLLTVNEVAHLLNIHPSTVRRWEKEGNLKSCRIGPRSSIRFKREDITRFISSDSKVDLDMED